MSTTDSRERMVRDVTGTIERRTFQADLELREDGTNTAKLIGWASVTDTAYEVRDFVEVITKGSFKRTLQNNADVVLLTNHTGLPLARTRSGTLALSEDERGLRFEADLDRADPDVQALLPKMARGDLTECSIAFSATQQEWSKDRSQRTITEVNLSRGDVSLVTMAASPTTSATLRQASGSRRRTSALSMDELRAETRIAKARWAALKGRPARRAIPKQPSERPKKPGSMPKYSDLELKELQAEGLAWIDGRGEWQAIKSIEDLGNAVASAGLEPASRQPAAKAKIIAAARKLGMTRFLPKTWLSPGRSAAQLDVDRRYRYRIEGERRDKEKRARERRLRRRGR